MAKQIKLMAEIKPEAVSFLFDGCGLKPPVIGEVVKGGQQDKSVLIIFGDGDTRQLDTEEYIVRMWEEPVSA
ncbi:MAG: hypothetical protein MUC28_02790 [Planctomycetes bacterium]|jgi:hypothetical protein|nr:hypothetical protein [Planctomycetota bacterium]